jgi:hypothetical protein
MPAWKSAVIVIVAFGLFVVAASSPTHASATPQATSVHLRSGRVGVMTWAASAEINSEEGSNDAAETCVSVATVEPGVPRGIEASEGTNCGEPESSAVIELANSRYGLVVAGLFRPDARQVVIEVRGRARIVASAGHKEIPNSEGKEVSFVARGFRPGTCIRRIQAIDKDGKVVSSVSSRHCIH